jgi:nitrite reductase/ring-hydroxylating ferredoxin subunit
MATSSHDFWLNNLTPKVWKLLHMQVYLAYALLILHVLLGVIQYETSPVFVALLAFGVTAIVTLHLVASRQERIVDEPIHRHSEEGLVHVCHVDEIPNNRARIFPTDNERIAIFKYDGKLSAISNVCKHQNGPLGEGRIVDGCVTCPWHGYQYLPHNGSSPPPFKEKVATYRVKIINHEVWVDPKPYPEGTEVEPAYLDVT